MTPTALVRSAASMAAAKEAVAAKAKEAYAEVVAAQREEGGVSMLSLLATPPQQSCMWVQVGLPRARPPCRFARPLIHGIPDSLTYSAPLFLKRRRDRTPQVSHDLIEFQTLGSWAPLYLHEVRRRPRRTRLPIIPSRRFSKVAIGLIPPQALGVPLGSVGAFMIWPMAVSMVGKLAITAWESRMVRCARLERLRANQNAHTDPCHTVLNRSEYRWPGGCTASGSASSRR